jgi:organic radical activating enzyme
MKHFCREKWEWLGVRILDWEIRSCSSSVYGRLLKDNPTANDFFNFSKLVEDRQAMLNDQRLDRCNFCWFNEDKNITSRRQQGNKSDFDPKFTQIENVKPIELEVMTSPDCLNQCVYCSPNYSSSWTKDILQNGNYQDEHFAVNERVKLHYLANQKQKSTANRTQQFIQLLNDEFFDQLKEIRISGGEPFLDHNFQDLVNSLSKKSNVETIHISTGLNFNIRVLEKFLSNTTDQSKLIFRISCEAVGELHSFIRWGMDWSVWKTNMEFINQHWPNQYIIKPTLNCLAMPNIVEFLDIYKDQAFEHSIVSEPAFLSPTVLPIRIKDKILEEIKSVNSNNYQFNELKNVIIEICLDRTEPSEQTRKELSNFLNRFVQNKKIDLRQYIDQDLLAWIQQ